jgi:hypothetical protein
MAKANLETTSRRALVKGTAAQHELGFHAGVADLAKVAETSNPLNSGDI